MEKINAGGFKVCFLHLMNRCNAGSLSCWSFLSATNTFTHKSTLRGMLFERQLHSMAIINLTLVDLQTIEDFFSLVVCVHMHNIQLCPFVQWKSACPAMLLVSLLHPAAHLCAPRICSEGSPNALKQIWDVWRSLHWWRGEEKAPLHKQMLDLTHGIL